MGLRDRAWDGIQKGFRGFFNGLWWIITFQWARKDKDKERDKYLERSPWSTTKEERDYVGSFKKAIKETLKKEPDKEKKKFYKKIFYQLLNDEEGLLLLKIETDNLMRVLLSMDYLLEKIGLSHNRRRDLHFWRNTRIFRRGRVDDNWYKHASSEQLINYAFKKYVKLLKISMAKRDLVSYNNKRFTDALHRQMKNREIIDEAGEESLNQLDKDNKYDVKQEDNLKKLRDNSKEILKQLKKAEKMFQKSKMNNRVSKMDAKSVRKFMLGSGRSLSYSMGLWVFEFLQDVSNYFQIIQANLKAQFFAINQLRLLAGKTKITTMPGVSFNFNDENISFVVNGLNKTQRQDAQNIWRFTTNLMKNTKEQLIEMLGVWKDINEKNNENKFDKLKEFTGFDVNKTGFKPENYKSYGEFMKKNSHLFYNKELEESIEKLRLELLNEDQAGNPDKVNDNINKQNNDMKRIQALVESGTKAMDEWEKRLEKSKPKPGEPVIYGMKTEENIPSMGGTKGKKGTKIS